MVEVQEYSYRQAADELGIKLENLKMVIFRSRRKIHRAMRRVFDGMSPDCRPAREPRGVAGETDRLEAGDVEGGNAGAGPDAGEYEGLAEVEDGIQ
jgi:hypothetical protein